MAIRFLLAMACFCLLAPAQTSSEVLGLISDAFSSPIPAARITARNQSTNLSYFTIATGSGTYRLPYLPPGEYEVSVESPGFVKYTRRSIVLRLGQQAELNLTLQLAPASESISIVTDAFVLNTTNAEVSTNIDARRIAELPLAPNRNVLTLVLQAPGVSQLSSGNSTFASGGVAFSVNGMRTRSNNFMIDGADSNNPSVSGLIQEINNPDLVAEFRLITNQFLPEYGRAAGSAVNIVTRSGTNSLHGTAYWSHNSNRLNSRNNLDKRNFPRAPWRVENHFGSTLGGPVARDRTFFFVSLLRWTDRRLASGNSITGAPTEEGRAALQSLEAGRPQITALLNNLPAAQQATGQVFTVFASGRAVRVPVGTLSGSAPNQLDAWQWSGRLDHRFNNTHNFMSRVMFDDRLSIAGQAVPAGLTALSPARRQAYNATLTSTLSPRAYNELRLNFQRLANATSAVDPTTQNIPSIEINTLGLIGINSTESRTAIGLGVNLPQAMITNNYQLADNFAWIRDKHSFKFGFDFRRAEQFQEFNPSLRGRLLYTNLQDFVDDVAQVQAINQLQPGLPTWQTYRYYDYFAFFQDEWRLHPRFTLTYGIRYETPGNPFNWLVQENNRVAAGSTDPGYLMDPGPRRDRNNWAPRIGFNYRLGGFVLRGGYSRTYDFAFNNILLNTYSAWPFTYVLTRPARSPNAFTTIDALRRGGPAPLPANLMSIPRTHVDSSFRSPFAEQFSTQLQRELGANFLFTLGHIATKGTALFQTIDANPTLAGTSGTQRLDPTRGTLRHRANTGSSIYHSLQTTLEKRFSRGYQFSAHYTWSSFIDDQSDIFNPSLAGEVALAQDSFNRRGDRGRSTYDRPHRFSLNGLWNLPRFGLQLGGFLTFQSGPPFSPLAGNDPGFRLSGIDALAGNSLRPHVATSLDVSGMTVAQLFEVRQTLFSPLSAADPIGNAGRNILRADGISSLDLVLNRPFRLPWEGHTINLRAEAYNLTNTRDFGIPNSMFTSAAFLNQWNTNGGARRVVLLLRYQF